MYVTACSFINTPWKLCSSVSCNSRAMRVRSPTRPSKRRLNCRATCRSRLVDLQIAYSWGQAHVPTGVGSYSVGLVVGCDLFDVHRRRKFVQCKVMRIEDAYAIMRVKPQFSIRCLGDLRSYGIGFSNGPYPIRTVDNCRLDHSGRDLVFVH